MGTTPKIVRYRADEWSALYIDGELVVLGDSYHSDEKLAEILGVDERDGYLLMPVGTKREDVPSTLEGAESKVAEKEAMLRQAEELEAEANRLRAAAAQMEANARGVKKAL